MFGTMRPIFLSFSKGLLPTAACKLPANAADVGKSLVGFARKGAELIRQSPHVVSGIWNQSAKAAKARIGQFATDLSTINKGYQTMLALGAVMMAGGPIDLARARENCRLAGSFPTTTKGWADYIRTHHEELGVALNALCRNGDIGCDKQFNLDVLLSMREALEDPTLKDDELFQSIRNAVDRGIAGYRTNAVAFVRSQLPPAPDPNQELTQPQILALKILAHFGDREGNSELARRIDKTIGPFIMESPLRLLPADEMDSMDAEIIAEEALPTDNEAVPPGNDQSIESELMVSVSELLPLGRYNPRDQIPSCDAMNDYLRLMLEGDCNQFVPIHAVCVAVLWDSLGIGSDNVYSPGETYWDTLIDYLSLEGVEERCVVAYVEALQQFLDVPAVLQFWVGLSSSFIFLYKNTDEYLLARIAMVNAVSGFHGDEKTMDEVRDVLAPTPQTEESPEVHEAIAQALIVFDRQTGEASPDALERARALAERNLYDYIYHIPRRPEYSWANLREILDSEAMTPEEKLFHIAMTIHADPRFF